MTTNQPNNTEETLKDDDADDVEVDLNLDATENDSKDVDAVEALETVLVPEAALNIHQRIPNNLYGRFIQRDKLPTMASNFRLFRSKYCYILIILILCNIMSID